MKYWIPFVALGLLTLSGAISQAQSAIGQATVLPNAPAAQYTAGPNGTAAVPGQSSHTISYTNNGAADYMRLLSWTLTLNLGGQSASAGGAKAGIVWPGFTWNLVPNPTLLNTQGNFAPGLYSVTATTQLFSADNALTLIPAGTGRTFLVVPAARLAPPSIEPAI